MYHFNRLKADKNGGTYVLGLSDKTNKTIEYTEEEGTYINKLPIVFMNNLAPKLNIPNVHKKEYFYFPDMIIGKDKEKSYMEQCNAIFNAYEYYGDLFGFIQKETNSERYSEANLKKLLQKQYDAAYLKKIIAEDLPYLYEKLAKKINSYTEFKSLVGRINQERWHLMSMENKKKFLCELLEEDALEEEKWMIVLQPYNHNYKAFWYIVQNLGCELKPEYKEIKNKFDNFNSDAGQVHSGISKQAESLLKNYLENKETGVSAKLYNICLRTLQDMVREFDLPVSKKAELLFNITKSKVQKARSFWECFEWETLEPYIVRDDHAE